VKDYQAEYERWLNNTNPTKEAEEIVRHALESDPSRPVQGRFGNSTVRFTSIKNCCTVDNESRTYELARSITHEHDDDVIRYTGQPPAIKVSYTTPEGKKKSYMQTADFFVLRFDSAGWEEVKPEKQLLMLAEKFPERWHKDEQGKWHFVPGEEYAAQYGLFYKVISSADLNQIYVRNMNWLADFYLSDHEVDRDVCEGIIDQVAKEPGIKLEKLLRLFKPSDIYRLIALGTIYVDLYVEPLPEPERVHVFVDQTFARAYASISRGITNAVAPAYFDIEVGNMVMWGGKSYVINNDGVDEVKLMNRQNKEAALPRKDFEQKIVNGEITGIKTASVDSCKSDALKVLEGASKNGLADANRIYEEIKPFLNGKSAKEALNPRTIRDYISRYNTAEFMLGCGYLGLITHKEKRGNRTPRLPLRSRELAEQVIDEFFEASKAPPRISAHGRLEDKCKTEKIPAPSYGMFCRMIRNRSLYMQILKRFGRRAAYLYEPRYFEVTQGMPVNGDMPFQVVHIDHTELDIEIVDSKTGRNLGRPWVTFMMDAFSRHVLAFHLTFDSPSSASVMAVIRECVRRFNRLPQFLVVDGGKEFRSIYFETLLARFQVTKITRPPAKPRFGAVLERIFGTMNTAFLYRLTANTQIMKNVRQVTKQNNPSNHAIWTLEKLHERLMQWAYEIYDTIDHPELCRSPREAFEVGMWQAGEDERLNRVIMYDEEFVNSTYLNTRQGAAKVQPRQGVKIKGTYYWHQSLNDPKIVGTKVEVRYDPSDIGHAYAFVNGIWLECFSRYYSKLHGKTEKEIRFASDEQRKRSGLVNRKYHHTPEQMVDFMKTLDEDEVELRRAKESRKVLNRANSETDVQQKDAPDDMGQDEPISQEDQEPEVYGGF
jgi:transposase InsO family protein